METDEELAGRTRGGDRRAGGVLVERHTGLVRRCLKRLKVPPAVEYDDLMQAGRLALFLTCWKWEPGRGTKFSTFAYRAIWWAVLKELQEQEPEHLQQEGATDTLDTYPAPPPGATVDLSGLTPRERVLLSLVYGLDGPALDADPDKALTKACRRLGLNRRQAEGVRGRALARLSTVAG